MLISVLLPAALLARLGCLAGVDGAGLALFTGGVFGHAFLEPDVLAGVPGDACKGAFGVAGTAGAFTKAGLVGVGGMQAGEEADEDGCLVGGRGVLGMAAALGVPAAGAGDAFAVPAFGVAGTDCLRTGVGGITGFEDADGRSATISTR